tara:strand:- start:75 stop:266 length:192 start_codon:yes stop_codon:yes gene_type:complete
MSIMAMCDMIIKNQIPELIEKIEKCKQEKFLSVFWIKNLDVLTTFAVNSDEVYELLSNNKDCG